MKNASIINEIASFSSELRRYLKIILALLRREEEIRRHSPFESILELLEPIILITTISLLRYFVNSHDSSPLGGSVVLFYATGFFPKYLFIYVSRYMPYGSPRRRFPIEQRLDYILAHVILRIIDYAVLGFFSFGILYLFFTADAVPYSFLPIVPALASSVMLGFGWGMFNMLLGRFIWFWRYFSAGLNRALVMLSGAIFVPDFLPPHIRYVLSFNPEMHAIALFRTGFYPHYPTIVLDTTYLTYSVIVAVLVGLVLERVTRRVEHIARLEH